VKIFFLNFFLNTIPMKDQGRQDQITSIVPMLYMNDVGSAIDFYKRAFNAEERWRVKNNDGSTHVAELLIAPAIFRLHEDTSGKGLASPAAVRSTTVRVDLLVANPDELFRKAIAAGAKEISPVQDYEYGFRQGSVVDPFGHQWCLEKSDGSLKTPLLPV
jgi:PhnB protein